MQTTRWSTPHSAPTHLTQDTNHKSAQLGGCCDGLDDCAHEEQGQRHAGQQLVDACRQSFRGEERWTGYANGDGLNGLALQAGVAIVI